MFLIILGSFGTLSISPSNFLFNASSKLWLCCIHIDIVNPFFSSNNDFWMCAWWVTIQSFSDGKLVQNQLMAFGPHGGIKAYINRQDFNNQKSILWYVVCCLYYCGLLPMLLLHKFTNKWDFLWICYKFFIDWDR